jgi:TolB-like protein
VVDKDNLLFFGYHEKGNMGGRLRNTLKIIDQNNGDLILAETLNESLQNAVPDSFFLQGNMIYFVKERSSLTAVNIDDLKR